MKMKFLMILLKINIKNNMKIRMRKIKKKKIKVRTIKIYIEKILRLNYLLIAYIIFGFIYSLLEIIILCIIKQY